MKVFITKYALTEGIGIQEYEVKQETDSMVSYKGFNRTEYFSGKDWHETKEAAIEKAEDMRNKKLISLKEEVEKINNLKFE